ncbi:MAG TPA: winged helix DNA-binding protein [Sphingomicrobium sp.]|nr:winged helix DNA-binding protein [Sphingomicrobium sp.]
MNADASGSVLPASGAREPGTIADLFSSSHAARLARAAIEARARRQKFFKASLFSDPAWDILLDLFAAEAEGRRVAISSAGLAANVPLTTAIRWINALQEEGLVSRENDPLDGRRSFLTLTEQGLRSMHDYFGI